jgi:glycosyltransferase involved in cell wall biosynthesis
VRSVVGQDAPILLVPNGIDSRSIAVTDYPAEDGLQICFLGHIQQEKGINAFIRVWLASRRPGDRLIAAGHSVGGAYFEEFKALVAQSEGAVRYLGYVGRGEVMKLLADSHFLVLPSGLEEQGGMRENFGNVVAEAMAAGRPVLVARGLAWDHVESNHTGFLFERSAGSVGEALRRAQGLDRSDWLRMSGSARRYVEQQLDPVRLGEQVWRALTDSRSSAVSAGVAEGGRP